MNQSYLGTCLVLDKKIYKALKLVYRAADELILIQNTIFQLRNQLDPRWSQSPSLTAKQ